MQNSSARNSNTASGQRRPVQQQTSSANAQSHQTQPQASTLGGETQGSNTRTASKPISVKYAQQAEARARHGENLTIDSRQLAPTEAKSTYSKSGGAGRPPAMTTSIGQSTPGLDSARPGTTKDGPRVRKPQGSSLGDGSLPKVTVVGRQSANRNSKGRFQTMDANLPPEMSQQQIMRRENSTTAISYNQGASTSSQLPMSRQVIQGPHGDNSSFHKVPSKTVSIQGGPRQRRQGLSNPNPSRIQTGTGLHTAQGSRFRVAVPLHVQNTPHSQAAQKHGTSGNFWNQVANHIGQSAKSQSMQKYQMAREGATNEHPMVGDAKSGIKIPGLDGPQSNTEIVRRHQQQQYSVGVKSGDPRQARPFSFLTSVGGKETTQARVTLRTGPGVQRQHNDHITSGSGLPQQKLKSQEAEKLAIFTDMDVDKHDHDKPGYQHRHVVYLQPSSTSNQAPAAGVKISMTLEKTKDGQRSYKQLAQSTSNDKLQFRPTSGLSKSGSQSRFKKSQREFRIQSGQPASRPISGRVEQELQGSTSHRKPQAQLPTNRHPQQVEQSEIYEELFSEDQIDEVEDENDFSRPRLDGNEQFCQQLMDARPTTALVGSHEAEDQLPYPELFDRSERTYAATFAKYGDLSYFTPVQRIGNYMEYQARLKKRHLMDLIAYLKTSKCQIKVDDEGDAGSGLQNAQDFLDHCLFHGLMQEEEANDQEIDQAQINEEVPQITFSNYNQPLPLVKAYDPCSAKINFGLNIEKIWSPQLLRQVQISIYRMLHYIDNPDSIQNKELSKYRKEWMKRALDLVPDYLLSTFATEVKVLFHDIFQNYIRAMKLSIMDYILRSPDERKRLHILMLPQQVLTAAERQAQYGGYSITEFRGTHQRKIHAENEIKFRLITQNIVVSQLQNWWQEFRNLKLVDVQNFQAVVKARNIESSQDAQHGSGAQTGMASYALDIDNFLSYQESILEKTVALMRHIWHRGAMLIIKKFKMLRSKEQQKEVLAGNAAKSKWSYSGFQPMPLNLGFGFETEQYDKMEKVLESIADFSYVGGSNKETQMDVYQQYCLRTAAAHQNVPKKLFSVEDGLKLNATVNDFLEDTTLDKLVDIRECPAYIAFVSMIGGFTDYDENGYEILSKTYKRELKYAAGNQMRLQLRQMIDQSVKTLSNFFTGFKTFSQLKEKMGSDFKPLRQNDQFITQINWANVKKQKKRGNKDEAPSQTASKKHEAVRNVQLEAQLKRRQQSQNQSAAMTFSKRKLYTTHVEDQQPLNQPDFMDYQDFVNPIFHMELLLGVMKEKDGEKKHGEDKNQFLPLSLEFNKSDEQILHSFEEFFEDLVVCFNEFSRPEFCKIQVYTRKKYEYEMQEQDQTRRVQREYSQGHKRRRGKDGSTNPEMTQAFSAGIYKYSQKHLILPKLLQFDKMLYPTKEFEGPYSYERYMGRIKVKEAPSDVVSKDLVDKETRGDTVFTKDVVNRKMMLATPGEDFFKKQKREILKVLTNHLHEVKRAKEVFDDFREIWSDKMQKKVKEFINQDVPPLERMNQYADFLSNLRRYRGMARQLPTRIAFPLFEVGCSIVKEEIQDRIKKFMIQVLKSFENDLSTKTAKLCEEFRQISEQLDKHLTTAQEVVEMDNYKNNLLLDMSKLQRKLAFNRQCTLFLACQNEYDEVFQEPKQETGKESLGECQKHVLELSSWPKRLNEHMEKADERHACEREAVENEVIAKKAEFDKKVDVLQAQMQKITQMQSLVQYKSYIRDIENHKEKLEEMEQHKQEIMTEETLLFGNKTDFHALLNVQRFFDPYYELWTRINDMMTKKNTWLRSRLHEIDSDEVNNMIKDSLRSVQKLHKIFGEASSVQNLLASMKREIDELNGWLPRIEVLCNKALKTRHWSKIKEITGMSSTELNFAVATLREILTLDVQEVLEELAEISEKAKKQSRLEEMLRSMQKEWEPIHFEITSFRDTRIPILKGDKIEDMQTMLDEHVLVSQTIKNSPDVLPLIHEASQWERTMIFTQEILEIWLKVQTSYLFLYPIFNSAGIQEEVKNILDSDAFLKVDEAWREIMNELKNDTKVLNLGRIKDLEHILSSAHESLENIQKNLNEYLENKRKAFPRFYFLSNEDLIQILGDVQNPKKIQQHLKKCFEGIDRVTFHKRRTPDEQLKPEIIEIVSKEGEKVDIVNPIMPHEYSGRVEQWLLELESQMRISIKKVITEGMKDYPLMPLEDPQDNQSVNTQKQFSDRTQWLARWQSQVTIVVSQINWTMQVEQALNSVAQQKMLVKLFRQTRAHLGQIVTMVREKLPDLLRLTLGTLIIINQHCKEIVENLARKRVNSTKDFDWISQLRYYYNQEFQQVTVNMITTNLQYSNEFLGNSGRLVITPLTDRCYRTLMSALVLNLGGAPEGPAGTGKTETVKDLSKAIAVHCIVFNCAEGLNAKAMAKFFKGLASGGSWSCFDEFNRIELEVLSVIAQQVLEIQKAKAAGVKKFHFEESLLELKPSVNIFITMNPAASAGYLSRSELPDNLKALFRPVAMMIPDYTGIAEISLYSFGFFDSQALAKKIVQTYRLCSEQLSTQDHYDYGMRAVKSVLMTAKNLKYQATRKASRGLPTQTERKGSIISQGNVSQGSLSGTSVDETEDMLILRSIRDVNLPKFQGEDIPLFEGIIKDLFPEIELPQITYPSLQQCIDQVLKDMNLQKQPSFIEKIIQVYDMIKCRHGMMLVGTANSGKTTTYKVLAKSITKVAEQDPSFEELKVETYVINPKSISLAQLYGHYDSISQEFTDGVLGAIFRFCASKTPLEQRRWIVFDGPVDANWIENMNTVLDDNKRLCLMNSEIIQMSETMNMLFETHDLSKASPATVSRCGMIYLPSNTYGGPKTLLNSWLNLFEQRCDLGTLAHAESDFLPNRMKILFNKIFKDLLDTVTRQCRQVIPAGVNELTASMLKIMTIMTSSEEFMKAIHEEQTQQDEIAQRFDMIFLYACVWSIGAILDETSRGTFNIEFRRKASSNYKIQGKQFRIERSAQIPDAGLPVTNYYVDGALWISWKDVLNRPENNQEFDLDLEVNEIIVPTTENFKQNSLLTLFTEGNAHVLFVGPTGTGKTVAVQKYLRQLNSQKYDSLQVCFSAKTSAHFTQQIIESKLEKNGRRTLGPSAGKKQIVFVDDLNMPTIEVMGAQPPIELLRQWMDYRAWYDLTEKGNPLRKVQNLIFTAAMCPPDGGKNQVTPRLTRHFNIISCGNFEKEVIERIYGKVMEWHIRKENILGTESARVLKGIVPATIDILQFAMTKLRPTPKNAHYLFNLRDASRVVQGVQMMRNFVHSNTSKLIRLWVHEIARVFSDRLTTWDDQKILYDKLFKAVRDNIKEDLISSLKEILPEVARANLDPPEQRVELMTQIIQFSDMLDGGGKGVRESKESNLSVNRGYDEILESQTDDLGDKLGEVLQSYNLVSRKRMDLVLFNFAVTHLLRICRVLKMNRGNALLIGLGGSGRQSLTYLASFIMDQALAQPEQTKNYTYDQWQDDMKRLLDLVGCDCRASTFLLTDTQLKFNFMLEDVNNLINQYEIPNLFGPDDKIIITEKVRMNAKRDGLIQLYNTGSQRDLMDYFTVKVKQNLHVVLAMSPTGGNLNERIRNFPSLVNCCTVDWFTAWPEEALQAVAAKFMEETPFDEAIKASIVQTCHMFHTETLELSETYLKETHRTNYVTPTSYLDLMLIFQKLLDKQRNKLYDKKVSYETGIDKLIKTAEAVTQMQHDLNEKQPQLEQMEKDTDALMQQIHKESVEVVEPHKKAIQAEEEEANAVAMEAQHMKIECENNLAKALPILKQALAALDTIKPSHINEIKVLQHPPVGVRTVLHAVCVLCDRKCEKTPKKDNPKQLEDNWWLTAQKFMAEKNFLQQLLDFDKDHIPDVIIDRIQREFLDDPDFRPKRVEKASFAAKGLCEWVIKLKQYDEIVRFIKPKREQLSEAQKRYKDKMKDLAVKQEELKAVVHQFEALQQKLQETSDHKQQLKNDIEECQIKLERAKALLEGLGGERERWIDSLDEVESNLTTIVPDVLLSSAIVAYLGAFTQNYRRLVLDSWLFQMQAYSLRTSDNFTLEKVLGEQVLIRRWQMSSLPVDSFSIENAIMMYTGMKWPMMVDPQGQANRWLKNMEMQLQEQINSGSKLIIVKPSDHDFTQRFEQAVRMGLPLLLESCGEDLDPILDPILLKQIFKAGGTKQIKFGDNTIDYADEFRLYMTTRLSNPHFLPEMTIKVQIINFMITFEGLREQLLNLVVRKENEALDQEHEKLIITQYENNKMMRDIEETILKVLKDSKGNILDDERAIVILKHSQSVSEQIKIKHQEALVTEQRLNAATQSYYPIASHSAMLFFLISKLQVVDVMYQYSLSWFIQLFTLAVDNSRDLEEPSRMTEEGGTGSESVEDLKVIQQRSSVKRRLTRQVTGLQNNASVRNMSIHEQSIFERVTSLINYFTLSLYENVCRSIFEKDKLLFSFMLTTKIRQSQGKLTKAQYQLLTENISGHENPLRLTNTSKDWLPQTIWNKLCTCAHKDSLFDSLVKNFSLCDTEWRKLYECEVLTDDLFPPNKDSIKGEWSPFMKLIILKAIRPDKLVQAIKEYVLHELGAEFLNPPIFDLDQSYGDSNSSTPLIFVLPGTDPLQQLTQFAQSKRKYDTMQSISLGQNQGARAEKVIAEARKHGSWVLLQNCHLYPSWMPSLEQICEQIVLKTQAGGNSSHPSFRLWLTSYPTKDFPSTILQTGVKMTNEPPAGLKANMIGSYKAEPLSDPGFLDRNSDLASFRKLAYGLTMFHAILLQRREFGALGWNIQYQFTVSDLQISMRQLHYFVDKYDQVPFNALSYLIGDCNYGGRVTEENDQKVLKALLEDFMHPKVLEEGYAYGDDKETQYLFPSGENGYHTYIENIESMPDTEPPQIFGFHPNADITKDRNLASELVNQLLKMGEVEGCVLEEDEEEKAGPTPAQDPLLLDFKSTKSSKSKGQGQRPLSARNLAQQKLPEDQRLDEICEEIFEILPETDIDVETCLVLFPTRRENSINTVLTQEVMRFNKLYNTIIQTLENLQKAQAGKMQITESLQQSRLSLQQGFIPQVWLAVSYPSLKPLSSYVRDLALRIKTLKQWINDEKPPEVFWISGFFFTQSFLTAILQNYARKHLIEIDQLHFEFDFQDQEDPTDHEVDIFEMTLAKRRGLKIQIPEDGAMISGLYFEGCRWDYQNCCLAEQHPKELFSKVPIVHLRPSCSVEAKSPTTLKTGKTGTLKDLISARNFGSFVDSAENKVPDQQPALKARHSVKVSLRDSYVQQQNSADTSWFGDDYLDFEDPHAPVIPDTHYTCPIYRTSERKGVLRTTGHSSNFILNVQVPMPVHGRTEVDEQGKKSLQEQGLQKHWIKRGAAMLCQLSQ